MLLSVIIVNYNVKYFLEQCLFSVGKALGETSRHRPGSPTGGLPLSEIIVVDNHSSDGSLEYLRPKFPKVQFIENEENIGFARANNQALKLAKGQYILFLNPDTILAEDSLSRCISFIRSTPDAGALGVRMIDGSGAFLKESRRGFPSPWVAFCKLSGLTALFPHSRLLAGYYLGHLPEHKNHAVPVLSGAFLLVRKTVLDKTGGFDEQFFMYAEDIDLSYRIGQAGFTNYYIAETTILHFKGESTRKDIRYVKLFYKAMSQFRRKHSRGAFSRIFNGAVEAAIWVRAGITAVGRSFGTGRDPVRQRFADKGVRAAGRKVRAGAGGIWIAGDKRAKEKLLRASGESAFDERHADEIIFCEGEDFSFRDIIAALQRVDRKQTCKIHAAASSSAVGSYSKDGRGEAIALSE